LGYEPKNLSCWYIGFIEQKHISCDTTSRHFPSEKPRFEYLYRAVTAPRLIQLPAILPVTEPTNSILNRFL